MFLSHKAWVIHQFQIVVAVCVALSFLAAATGCAKKRFLERSTVSVTEMDRIHRRYITTDVYEQYRQLNTPQEKREYRDEVVHARMRYINAHYEVLVRELQYGRAGKDFAVDAVEITLDAVGALAGTAATKAILHAISGGLIGLNASFDQAFYQEQASFVIVQKMDELRDTQQTKISAKLQLPAIPSSDGQGYGFGAAMADLDHLMRAGSITRALIELSKSAGADAEEAAQIKDREEMKSINSALRSAGASQLDSEGPADNPDEAIEIPG